MSNTFFNFILVVAFMLFMLVWFLKKLRKNLKKISYLAFCISDQVIQFKFNY